MTVKSICELASNSLANLADMMARKGLEISGKDPGKAGELNLAARALRDMGRQIAEIGGIQQ